MLRNHNVELVIGLLIWVGRVSLFKRKKSEIQNRAKRLLDAFASEARKQASVRGQRKLIRAQYENGLLLLKEDFVRLPYGQITYSKPLENAGQTNRIKEPPPRIMQTFSPKVEPLSSFDMDKLTGKEKLSFVLNEIVQMYSLQFKIVDELMGILKSELKKF